MQFVLTAGDTGCPKKIGSRERIVRFVVNGQVQELKANRAS